MIYLYISSKTISAEYAHLSHFTSLVRLAVISMCAYRNQAIYIYIYVCVYLTSFSSEIYAHFVNS